MASAILKEPRNALKNLAQRNECNTTAFNNITDRIWGSGIGKAFPAIFIVSIIIFVVFGTLTGQEARDVTKNLSTPMIGVLEHIQGSL